MGAMLSVLQGRSKEEVDRLKKAIGKTIKSIKLDPEGNGGDGSLEFKFEDGSWIQVVDDARSCCESRFMNTDDDLNYYNGAILNDIRTQSGGTRDGDYETTEVMFLMVDTSIGTFTISAYNRHNGYYGGICIRVYGG